MIETTQVDNHTFARISRGKVNAFDLELLNEFNKFLDEEAHSDSGAIVLTGHGRTFSAGVDLFQLLDGGDDYIKEFIPKLSDTFLKLYQLEKPVITAINGHAIAGGCILACCSDYRFMATGAGKIGAVELKVGVAYPFAALEILRTSVNHSSVNDVIFVANTYDENKALTLGLIDEVVGPENLMSRSASLAEELARIPRKSFALSKRQLRQPVVERIRANAAEWDKQALDVWLDKETQAYMKSYLDASLKK